MKLYWIDDFLQIKFSDDPKFILNSMEHKKIQVQNVRS